MQIRTPDIEALFLLCLLLLMSPFAQAAAPAKGAWHFDETQWVGNQAVKDSSGNGFHGTAMGNAHPEDSNPARPGSPGTCGYAELDGNGDFIHLGNPSGLNFSGRVTLAAWIRLDTNGSPRGNIIDHGYSPSSSALYVSSGKYTMESFRNSGPYIDSYIEKSIPSADTLGKKWTHIAGTFDGSKWRLYRDGNLMATKNETQGVQTTFQSWGIGADATGVSFFKGAIDEPRIFDRALSLQEIRDLYQEVRPCPGAPVTTLHIQHDQQGVFYCPERMTVQAKLANGNIDTAFTGQFTLAPVSSQGYWQKIQGSGSFNDNNGALSYTFAASDQGQAQFDWIHTGSSHALNFALSSSTMGVQLQAVNAMSYADAGFVIEPQGFSLANALVAGAWSNYLLKAVNSDFARNSCQVLGNYQGVKSLRWQLGYTNPNSGSQAITLQSPGQGSSALGGSALNWPLNFSNGVASFQSQYRDVGQIRLSVQDNQRTAMGASADLLYRPHHAVLSLSATSPSPSGTFSIAGAPLNASLKAYDLTGQLLPNFGREAPAIQATINAQLVSPNSGEGAILGSIQGNPLTHHSNGTLSSNTLSYSEVGQIQFSVNQLTGPAYTNNWLSLLALSPQSQLSVTPGRFVPDHLAVSLSHGALGHQCGGTFNYIGQTLPWQSNPSLRVSAYDGAGNRLKNYALQGTTQLPSSNIQITPAAQDASNGLSVLATGFGVQFLNRLSASSELLYQINGNYAYTKTLAAERAPFASNLPITLSALQDQDGVTLNGHPSLNRWQPTPTTLRFGRTRLDTQHSGWLQPYPAVVTVEYFNGSQYVRSTDDNCSEVSNLSYADLDANDGYTFSGGWLSQVSPNASQSQHFTAANAGMLLYQMPSIQGLSQQAQVRLTAQVPSHLRYPWSTDGIWRSPSAQAVFGISPTLGGPHGQEIVIFQEMF